MLGPIIYPGQGAGGGGGGGTNPYATQLADPYYVAAEDPYQAPAEQIVVEFLANGEPKAFTLYNGSAATYAAVVLNVTVGAEVVTVQDYFGTPGVSQLLFQSTIPLDFSGTLPAALAILGLGDNQLVMSITPEPAIASTDVVAFDEWGVPGTVGRRLTGFLRRLRDRLDAFAFRLDGVGTRIDEVVRDRRPTVVAPYALLAVGDEAGEPLVEVAVVNVPLGAQIDFAIDGQSTPNLVTVNAQGLVSAGPALVAAATGSTHTFSISVQSADPQFAVYRGFRVRKLPIAPADTGF